MITFSYSSVDTKEEGSFNMWDWDWDLHSVCIPALWDIDGRGWCFDFLEIPWPWALQAVFEYFAWARF